MVNMKTVRQWVEEYLIQEEYDAFVDNVAKFNKKELFYLSEPTSSFSSAIDKAFTWDLTDEGEEYWNKICSRHQAKGQVIPEELGGRKIINTFVVGGDTSYLHWLNESTKFFFRQSDNIALSSFVIFTGGSDVSPELYNSTDPHSTVHSDFDRDLRELTMYQIAFENKLPMIGICRGAQFLCVQAGGKLVQHMSHPNKHNIVDVEGNIIEVTSSHHQMQLPPSDASILGFCQLANTGYISAKETVHLTLDVENVYYPKENALGIQSHPEWQSKEQAKYFVQLVEDFLEKKNYFEKGVKYNEKHCLKVYKEVKSKDASKLKAPGKTPWMTYQDLKDMEKPVFKVLQEPVPVKGNWVDDYEKDEEIDF